MHSLRDASELFSLEQLALTSLSLPPKSSLFHLSNQTAPALSANLSLNPDIGQLVYSTQQIQSRAQKSICCFVRHIPRGPRFFSTLAASAGFVTLGLSAVLLKPLPKFLMGAGCLTPGFFCIHECIQFLQMRRLRGREVRSVAEGVTQLQDM